MRKIPVRFLFYSRTRDVTSQSMDYATDAPKSIGMNKLYDQ